MTEGNAIFVITAHILTPGRKYIFYEKVINEHPYVVLPVKGVVSSSSRMLHLQCGDSHLRLIKPHYSEPF